MKKPGKMIAEALRSVLKKPATIKYPYVKVEMPDQFRGKLSFDASKCICCKLCMRDCPSNAIQIKKVGEKQFEAEIDLSRCIYCAQCVDSCPKDALKVTPEFELASLSRAKLKAVFHAQPPKDAKKEEQPKDAQPAPAAQTVRVDEPEKKS
jgi:formate hydrogenlyase subunit 6/NADH:ubiquinone oxidoreductase subunit I